MLKKENILVLYALLLQKEMISPETYVSEVLTVLNVKTSLCTCVQGKKRFIQQVGTVENKILMQHKSQHKQAH